MCDFVYECNVIYCRNMNILGFQLRTFDNWSKRYIQALAIVCVRQAGDYDLTTVFRRMFNIGRYKCSEHIQEENIKFGRMYDNDLMMMVNEFYLK